MRTRTAKTPKSPSGVKRAKPAAEAQVALALTPKGEAVRERILTVALEAFARNGFKNATTREIADAAGVNLPALQYYFGGKEDLYRACAESVVDRYRAQTDAIAEQALAVLASRPSAQAARVQLKALMHALAILLTGSKEAPTWAMFVARQMNETSKGLEILQKQLWSPGIDLVAQLISVAGDYDAASARIRAIWLISNATMFQPGRPILLQLAGWRQIGGGELKVLLAMIDRQIDEIGAGSKLK
ncbi:MAG: CerR family C-terminal domain-containing protein [Hyphomonadaceae bacterium]